MSEGSRLHRWSSPRRWLHLIPLILAAALALSTASPAAESRDVLVFAAASLKNALDDVAAQYRHKTGKQATISYGASSALAKQIEAAAPADIFISADLDWMDYLAKKSLIEPKSRKSFLGNALVMVAPKDSAVEVKIAPGFPLAEHLAGGKLAMADTSAVPAGKYGKAALEKLGVWAAVEHSIAQAENVRAALLLVARKEAPLGIVYRTDAAAEPEVKVVGTFRDGTLGGSTGTMGETADFRAVFITISISVEHITVK